MKFKKINVDGIASFNTYSVELSYGQMIAIRDALEVKHDNPLSDEVYAEWQYWLQNIPGPGESTEDFKAEKDAVTKTKDEAGQEIAPEDDINKTDAGLEAGGLPAPDEDEAGGEEIPDFEAGPTLSPEERDIIDRDIGGGFDRRPTGIRHDLPAPPAE